MLEFIKIIWPILIITVLIITGKIIIFNYTKCNKKIIFIFSMALACISFSYIPVETNDLFRHYLQIDFFKNYSIMDVMSYDFLFIINLVFYFISIINLKGLLPFLSTLITYYLLIYIAIDIAKTFKPGKLQYSIIILLLLGIIPYNFVVSGVRFYTCVAIFIYACYREFIKNNNNFNTKLLYIFPIFIHYSSVLFYMFKVLLKLTYKNKFIFGIVCLVLATYYYWKNILISILSNYDLGNFKNKVEMYSETFLYDSSWQLMQITFLFIVYILILFIGNLNKESIRNGLVEKKEIRLKYLSILFVAMSIGNIQSFYLSERFLVVAIIILIMHTLTIKIPKSSIVIVYCFLAFIVIGAAYYIQFARALTGQFEIFNIF
jgi:hypothetical protein